MAAARPTAMEVRRTAEKAAVPRGRVFPDRKVPRRGRPVGQFDCTLPGLLPFNRGEVGNALPMSVRHIGGIVETGRIRPNFGCCGPDPYS